MLLKAAGLAPLDEETAGRFEAYLSLFVRWNERLNLSAIRDEEGILSRHFVESIVVAHDIAARDWNLARLWIGRRVAGDSRLRFAGRRLP